MNDIRFEILNFSYWEHFKAAKDLSLVLPPEHPRRAKIDQDMNDILKEMQSISPKHKKEQK
jgi:hypothetical protein